MKNYVVKLKPVPEPRKDCSLIPVALTDETLEERRQKILFRMRAEGLERLVVYSDVEHGGNFEYLVGYYTRFEEGLLVIQADGTMSLVLGNENLNKAGKARVQAAAVHVPVFSLPNQPCETPKTLREQLAAAGLEAGRRTGVAGWKLFTSPYEDVGQMYDLPAFIMDALRDVVDAEYLIPAGGLFIGENGARVTNNANEIAHYEFAAALASDCILDAMDALDEGVPEMVLGDKLNRYGQHNSVVTIAASGPRFLKGNMYPTDNVVKVGDPISLTVGYRGGLSSRAGFAVHNASEMPDGQQDYLERVAAPYFNAYARWLEQLHVGMEGGALYELVEQVLPREKYGWGLCPGHLTAEEEWLCSPVRKDSKELLQSGMMLQIDIIPSVPGYGGTSAESTVALADAALREELHSQYPAMWERMQERRAYLKDVLGIEIPEDVLPMCSTVAYLRPYLLDHSGALTWEPTV